MCGGFSPVSRNSQRFRLIHVVTYQHLFLRVWERKQCWAFYALTFERGHYLLRLPGQKNKKKSGKSGRASGLISRRDGSLFYRSISFNFSGHFLVCPPRLLNTKWSDPASFRAAFIYSWDLSNDGRATQSMLPWIRHVWASIISASSWKQHVLLATL